MLILVSCKSSHSSLNTTEASAAAIDHSKCIFLGDAYEPKARLAAGSHKGECVETRYARSVIELPGNSTTIKIANFTHNQEFWVAEVPRNGVKNLIYQIEVFPAFENQPKDWELAGHSQVRIQFSPENPVRLTHQLDSTKSATLTDIVISAEALGEVGYSYYIFNGMKFKRVGGPFSLKFENDSDFNIVYRIVSLDDRYDWMINKQKHKVTQFPLTLSHEDKQKILPSFLDIAMKNKLDNPYHTIKINCANQIFLTFDNALTYPSFRKPKEDRYGLQESYPIGSYKSLVPRGLLKIDKSTETGFEMLPNLGDDPSAISPN
jgi:hypothetical protein